MRKRLLAMVTLGALAALGSHPAEASSHREAPFITKNPKVDGTDFYMFRSWENDDTVTLIANYQPLQSNYGGPNFFTMDPDALYEIHVDNTGDGREDLTFQFRFSNTLFGTGNRGIELPIALPDGGQAKNVAIPLINASRLDGGAVALDLTSFDNSANLLNVSETYSVKVVRGDRRTGTAADVAAASGGATTFKKPTDYIGSKSFGAPAAYEAYARTLIHTVSIPGCTGNAKVFVGQRKEGFGVNLGAVFDLVNAPLGVIADANNRNAVANPIGDKNVTSIALQIPTSCLTAGSQPIIGGWTSASVRQARVINPSATYDRPAREGGAWAQVSRLGHPLVNEVVIGLRDKDRFNSSHPTGDGQFADYVTHPTLPAILQFVFGSANAPAPTVLPRGDLVAVFLTGVPNVNKFPDPDGGALPPSEMLRLNTAVPRTAANARNDLGAAACFPRDGSGGTTTVNLGASGCDPEGFPNGRRPGDDTVDIALRVMMGYLLPAASAGAGGVPLHDAVLETHAQFDTSFPYLKTPNPGS